LTLTTLCLSEAPFVFANTGPLAPPPPIVIDRTVVKTVVSDEDTKSKYRSAVSAWVIIFIIVVLATACVAYLWWKGKKIMGQLSAEMI
jgi:hypothetical protein